MILGHNSGGGLFPFSEIMALEPGKAVAVKTGGEPYRLRTDSPGEPLVPGGPIYVVFGESEEVMKQLSKYLSAGGDWQKVAAQALKLERTYAK